MKYDIISGVIGPGGDRGTKLWLEVREAGKYVEGEDFKPELVLGLNVEGREFILDKRHWDQNNGFGTYWRYTEPTPVVIERCEWNLLDELEGWFDPVERTRKYREENARIERERAQADKAEKQAAKQERVASVEEDPKLIKLIDEILAVNEKAVSQYLAGKEKAINSVVGQVIGKMKTGWGPPNTLAIAVLVKQQADKLKPASADGV